MLRVEIRLDHSHGPQFDAVLGTLTIVNDGSGSLDRGNYRATLSAAGRRTRRCRIEDWPRTDLGAIELVTEALTRLVRVSRQRPARAPRVRRDVGQARTTNRPPRQGRTGSGTPTGGRE